LQQSPKAQCGSAKLVDRFAEFFDGVASLVLHFLHFLDTPAEQRHIGRKHPLDEKLVRNDIDELQSGKSFAFQLVRR